MNKHKYLNLKTISNEEIVTKVLCILKVREAHHIEALADGKIILQTS